MTVSKITTHTDATKINIGVSVFHPGVDNHDIGWESGRGPSLGQDILDLAPLVHVEAQQSFLEVHHLVTPSVLQDVQLALPD